MLMFKLLKEGIERECPNPPVLSSPLESSTFSASHHSRQRQRHTPASRLNLLLPITNVTGPSQGTSSGGSRGAGPAAAGAGGGGGGLRSPSLDTIISLPPPYDSQTMISRSTIPGDQPPSYEEATRKE